MSDRRQTSNGEMEPSAAAPRRTPYEAVFTLDRFEARVFPQIRAEAERLGVEPLQRDQFNLLASVGETVREFTPPDAPPEAFEQYRALLFHAFNLWRYGRWIYLVEPAVARYLVEASPRLEEWELELPHPSLYVQLPANLFWGSITPDSTPEAVDGFFVTGVDLLDPFGNPFKRLEVLLVLGMRRDRAGFSVIPFDTEAGPGIAAEWARASGREEGGDFGSVLPGGELSGLYSILTVGEVLKLLGRVLWYLDTFPEDIAPERAVEREAADASGAVPASRLPYHRVSLGDHGGQVTE